MKLHMHPLSGCSRRVLAFVSVHGIPMELVQVDLAAGEHKKPAFTALNPNGRVPVLEGQSGNSLWESAAILHYLAETNVPESLGTSPEERAAVQQWTAWGLVHLGGALSTLNAETGLKKMRGLPIDGAKVQAATEQVHAQLAILTEALKKSDFVVGSQPTTADFIMAPNLESSLWLSGFKITDPTIQAWFDRMCQLPNWPKAPAMPRG